MILPPPFPRARVRHSYLEAILLQKKCIFYKRPTSYIHLQTAREWGWYNKVWQAGAILLPVRSVGVMGDERTYDQAMALRAVQSVDAMTADWVHLPTELLAEVSTEIINKVRGGRVVYDSSNHQQPLSGNESTERLCLLWAMLLGGSLRWLHVLSPLLPYSLFVMLLLSYTRYTTTLE